MKHTVAANETLPSIAKQYLGDASLYSIIAKMNRISDAQSLVPGTVINIPDQVGQIKAKAKRGFWSRLFSKL